MTTALIGSHHKDNRAIRCGSRCLLHLAAVANFSSKNILIVGGTSGIGAALAQQAADAGGNVFTASRRAEGLGIGTHISFDATGDTGVLAASIPDVLHGLVYAPGTINLKPFARLTDDDFRHDFEVNVLGAVRVIRACLAALKRAEGASIVLFSTVAAAVGMPFHASIAAAKRGVEGLALSLAAEVAAQKIRVNVVAPSLSDTPLAGTLLSTPEKREAGAKRHPLGRVGSADDAAAAAMFLLSEESNWMTGQIMGVDGGMSTLRTG